MQIAEIKAAVLSSANRLGHEVLKRALNEEPVAGRQQEDWIECEVYHTLPGGMSKHELAKRCENQEKWAFFFRSWKVTYHPDRVSLKMYIPPVSQWPAMRWPDSVCEMIIKDLVLGAILPQSAIKRLISSPVATAAIVNRQVLNVYTKEFENYDASCDDAILQAAKIGERVIPGWKGVKYCRSNDKNHPSPGWTRR